MVRVKNLGILFSHCLGKAYGHRNGQVMSAPNSRGRSVQYEALIGEPRYWVRARPAFGPICIGLRPLHLTKALFVKQYPILSRYPTFYYTIYFIIFLKKNQILNFYIILFTIQIKKSLQNKFFHFLT